MKRVVFLLGGKQLGPAGGREASGLLVQTLLPVSAVAVTLRREVGPSAPAHVGGQAGSGVHSNVTMLCVHL